METALFEELLSYPTGLLVFRYADKEYCIDIKYVLSIVNPNSLDAAGYSINKVSHTVKYKDKSIPLLKSSVIFNSKISSIINNHRLIILFYNGQTFSFLVDKIIEIISLTEKMIKDISYNKLKENVYLTGSIEYEGRTIFVLNLKKLVK